MPKSAKKRRDKAADFSKAKLKLGKGKKLPSNAVDTSFKARSIALPTQSISAQRSEDIPTTKRRLTFDDLILQIRHHNASTRRDAILGLRELFDDHREIIDSSLTPLFNACVRLISDEDSSVRKALISFFAWLLLRIPPHLLVPHSSLILLFTTSALTHIFPEIRIDAVRILDILLEKIPDVVIEGWTGDTGAHGSRILHGYLGILNAGTKFGESEGPVQATSTASVVLSPGSKLIVLKSLSTFLQKAVLSTYNSSGDSQGSDSLHTWYLASSFAESKYYEAFETMLCPKYLLSSATSCRSWKEEIVMGDTEEDFVPQFHLVNATIGCTWSLQQLGEANDFTDRPEASFVMHLAHTLHSVTASTFLDSAPQVFLPASSPPDIDLALVRIVGDIARSLYGPALRQSLAASKDEASFDDLNIILGYMAPYFPFGRDQGSRDIKVQQMFQELDLIYCELTSMLVLVTHVSSIHSARQTRHKAQGKSKRSHGKKPSHDLRTEHILDYVLRLLKGEAMSSVQLPRPISPSMYNALLSTIWSIINDPAPMQPESPDLVIQAILEHSMRLSSSAATKPLTISFISRLILLDTEPQYQGVFKISKTGDNMGRSSEWIKHLPKVLWELARNDLRTAEIILRFLLRFFQRKSCLVRGDTVTAVSSRLIPLFHITHAVRGELDGPYAKLPVASPLRRLALDVVVVISSLSNGDRDDLLDAVDKATFSTEEHGYWQDVKRTINTRC